MILKLKGTTLIPVYSIAADTRINILKYIRAFVALLYPKIILPRRMPEFVASGEYVWIGLLYFGDLKQISG